MNARGGGVGNTLLAARDTGSSRMASYEAPTDTQEDQDDQQSSGPANLVPASMADAVLAAMSKTTPPSPSAEQRPVTTADLVRGAVPKPRPKPIEVLMLAAANMKIEPAAAPVPTNQNFNTGGNASPVRGNLGPTTIASLAYEDRSTLLASNATAKGSLNAGDAQATQDTGELRPLSVTYANTSSLSMDKQSAEGVKIGADGSLERKSSSSRP